MTTVIGIPLGTRLQQLVLVDGEVHVWTAVGKRGNAYSEWRGTFIRIEASGRVTRVTVDDNVPVEDEFVIREPP